MAALERFPYGPGDDHNPQFTVPNHRLLDRVPGTFWLDGTAESRKKVKDARLAQLARVPH